MDPLFLFKQTNFSNSIWWKLNVDTLGFLNQIDDHLVTEISANRLFRLVESNLQSKNLSNKSRLLVQLYEDGYLCWINIERLIFEKFDFSKKTLISFDESLIQNKIPLILNWIIEQSKFPNTYLWGGTIGPNFDCSGLLQKAFYEYGIFIPRDSYQMQIFCKHFSNFPCNINFLQMGDLLFFGDKGKCNHVGIYFKDGLYYHSSGKECGRDGIALESLINKVDPISLYYQSKLISIGRVNRQYQWNRTIR